MREVACTMRASNKKLMTSSAGTRTLSFVPFSFMISNSVLQIASAFPASQKSASAALLARTRSSDPVSAELTYPSSRAVRHCWWYVPEARVEGVTSMSSRARKYAYEDVPEFLHIEAKSLLNVRIADLDV